MHSALWHISAAQKRAFEWGSVTTRSLRSAGLPPISALKLPKSACAVPGAHPSSRKPSPAGTPCDLLHSATKRLTLE